MKAILEALFAGEKLSALKAQDTLTRITRGEFPDSMVAAFLSAYRMRPLNAEELRGFRNALFEAALKVDLGTRAVLDLCGTGGDGKNTFNISTVSAFIVAGAGVPVAKHGNYAASSMCGSSNVLEQLGIPLQSSADEVRRDFERVGIVFLHAPFFHPALKRLAPLRKELGFRTFINLLGPLLNPVAPEFQLCGVYSAEIAELYRAILSSQAKNFNVVHTKDGFDEVSLTSEALIYTPSGVKTLLPEHFSMSMFSEEDLKGGTSVAESAKIFHSILAGEGSKAQQSVVIANAALAIQTARPGVALSEAISLATEALNSGRALAKLKQLQV